jgi:hypothetical protein
MRVVGFLALATLCSAVHGNAEDAPFMLHFSDETAQSGLRSIYRGEWQYMVGGGVAVFDCNGDGLPEIFAAGGENAASLFINRSRQQGPLRFSRKKSVTAMAGVTGAYPLDVDSDGLTDLVVLRVGASRIFRGIGRCRFADMNAKWKVDGGDAWATAFAATWENGNRWPTLAFGAYIDRAFENEPWGHCSDNWLLRPNSTQNGFVPRVPLTPSYCSLSMIFTDWNRSGTPSLRVANDREYYQGGQEQLWKLPPNGAPALYTAKEGWKFQRFWGMGIAGADLNDDGYPEYMVTSMADQRLQFLSDGPAKPTYKDAPYKMGATAHRPFAGGDTRPSTGWHTQFEDVNNDGRFDLFIAKGNVDVMPDFAMKDPSNVLLQNADGSFFDVAEAAGLLNYGRGRGAAIADLNLDGKLDAVIVNRNENLRVWRNDSKKLGNWIGLKLAQDESNRDGIGAWIEVKSGGKVQRREITVGGGHVSGLAGFWHFGLAENVEAQVRVIWPGGLAGEWQAVKGNALHVLERDKPARLWVPGKPL